MPEPAPRDAATGEVAAPIPFREDAIAGAPDLAMTLGLLALLGLAALVALLRVPAFAKLRARLGLGPVAGAPADAPVVVSRRRVSAASSVIVIAHAGREYLLVESTRHVSLYPVEARPPGDAREGQA